MISRLCIKKPVTTVMFMLVVILGGIVAYSGLKMDLMPNVSIPVAIVSTSYSGAGPEEVETFVTEPIEDALASISNVDTISSTSSAGSSMVIVQFQDGTDVDMAAIDMRESVDMVKGFLPEDAGEPMVIKIDPSMMSTTYLGIKSETLEMTDLNALIEDEIMPKLEKVEGAASVSVLGGSEEEIEVIVETEKLQGYGLTLQNITSVIGSENVNYPMGQVDQGSATVQMKSNGKFTDIEEIKNLPITTSLGSTIHLSDVATVELVEKDTETYAIIDGSPAVLMAVSKQSNANLVELSEDLQKELDEINRDYEDIESSMVSDTGDFIKSTINSVTITAIQAAVIAIFVILAFLRSSKMSIIIGISIPTSIIITFAAMYILDMTMNMISMGGIAIGIGMLVDNSIVVLENIYSKMKEDPSDPKEAAAKGASEVSMAVLASTLTTMAVFIPLSLASGIVGDIFTDISLTICISLAASYVVSLTFVPMACSKLLKPEMFEGGEEHTTSKHLGKAFDKWGTFLLKLDAGYNKLLQWCLINKKKVVAFVVVIFIAILSLVPSMGVDFMPVTDEGVVNVNVKLSKGSSIEDTIEITEEVLETLSVHEEIETYYAMAGGAGIMGGSSDASSITLNLVDKAERDFSSEEFANKIGEELKNIPGAEITASASSSAMGSMGGSGTSIRITGDDSDVLRELGNDIATLLEDVEGVTEVSTSLEDTYPEANIIVNKEKASQYGLTAAQIANTVSSSISGSVATEMTIDGKEIDVRVKHDNIDFLTDVENISITSPRGVNIPLTELVEIEMGESSVSIARENNQRYVDVNITTFGVDARTAQQSVDSKLESYILPDGYSYQYTGNTESMNESFADLFLALIVAVLLVYMIMAGQFESFVYPFIVMFSMPLAITGGILGLYVTGMSITTVAFMGFIMLVGMVVNNAIVLVDAANQNVAKGMTAYEAISKAGPDRLRPILMTTLTTVLGMIPLALALSEGSEMQQPMGIAIIFGLTLSTFITLILIPVLYLLVEKLRLRSIKKKRENKKLLKKEKKANKEK